MKTLTVLLFSIFTFFDPTTEINLKVNVPQCGEQSVTMTVPSKQVDGFAQTNAYSAQYVDKSKNLLTISGFKAANSTINITKRITICDGKFKVIPGKYAVTNGSLQLKLEKS